MTAAGWYLPALMTAFAVLAKLTAVAGKRAELAEALQPTIANAEFEPGTRRYILHEDVTDDNVLWYYELYESEEDFDVHRHSAFARDFGPSLAGLMAGRLEMTKLQPLAGKGL